MKQHHQVQWPKNIIIKRAIGSENSPNNRAVLLVPKFRWGPLAKFLQPRLKKPYIRVKLDDFGTFVWNHCDGETNFQTIVKKMKEQFGENIEPAEQRLQQFLVNLKRSNFIELFQPHSE